MYAVHTSEARQCERERKRNDYRFLQQTNKGLWYVYVAGNFGPTETAETHFRERKKDRNKYLLNIKRGSNVNQPNASATNCHNSAHIVKAYLLI